MRSSLTIIAMLLGLKANAQFVTGYEEIIQGKLFCVHSELRIDTILFNTSSIFLLKGTNDSVHVLGMGYGKPEDLRVYRDCTTINTSFMQDVHLCDSLINSFGFAQPKLMFWVLHGHLDHVNAEFFGAMDSIFNTMQSKIFVHTREYTLATCNAYCCGLPTCSQGDPTFGAAYHYSWLPSQLAQFKKIGKKPDVCDQIIGHITTSYGSWEVLKAGTQHTPGGLNFFYPGVGGLKILGSEQTSGCNVSWGDVFNAHGDCNPAALYAFP